MSSYRSLPNPVICSFEEFNEHLTEAYNNSIVRIFGHTNKVIPNAAVLEEKANLFSLIYKKDNQKKYYVIEKNGNNEDLNLADVITIWAQVNKQCKFQKVKDFLPEYEFDTKLFRNNKEIGYRQCIGSASPERNSNPKFRNKAVENCYEYDLCHAYGQFLKEDVPDLSTVQYNVELKPGQIGFYIFGTTLEGFPRLCATTKVGFMCTWAFDLMESPFKKFVEKIIDKLDKETDKVKRNKLKNYFRIAVGELQNHNPFIRATIVEKCNKLILSLLDDNSIYWSTDSIISAVKRDDILESGYDWQIKHSGTFRLGAHLEHQWNQEVPVINGILKRYIKWYNLTHEKPFILLENKIPELTGSYYILDRKNYQLIVNEVLNNDKFKQI